MVSCLSERTLQPISLSLSFISFISFISLSLFLSPPSFNVTPLLRAVLDRKKGNQIPYTILTHQWGRASSFLVVLVGYMTRLVLVSLVGK